MPVLSIGFLPSSRDWHPALRARGWREGRVVNLILEFLPEISILGGFDKNLGGIAHTFPLSGLRACEGVQLFHTPSPSSSTQFEGAESTVFDLFRWNYGQFNNFARHCAMFSKRATGNQPNINDFAKNTHICHFAKNVSIMGLNTTCISFSHSVRFVFVPSLGGRG